MAHVGLAKAVFAGLIVCGCNRAAKSGPPSIAAAVGTGKDAIELPEAKTMEAAPTDVTTLEAMLLGGSAAVSQKKAVAAKSVRGTVDMTASALRADEVRVASRNIPFVGLADLEPQYLHQMRYTE